jgi:hypothetical protein
VANLFERANERHVEILQSHAAVTVNYRRPGAGTLTGIALTPGSARRGVEATGEMSFSDQDWIGPASLFESLGEPKRGDVIEYGTERFTVLPPADGVPCWEWYGKERIAYRIHSERTKK